MTKPKSAQLSIPKSAQRSIPKSAQRSTTDCLYDPGSVLSMDDRDHDDDQQRDGGLYDPGLVLSMDDHIEKLKSKGKLETRWQHSCPKRFGRRALEVAIYRSWNAARDEEDIKLDELKFCCNAANRAGIQLRSLLQKVSGEQPGAVITQDHLTPFMLQIASRTRCDDTSDDAAEFYGWGRRGAATLVDAARLLEVLEGALNAWRADLAKTRVNPGQPQKRAFVTALAEGWLFLTGSVPGSGELHNPFLRWAEAAWSDAGGAKDEPLYQALRAARSDVRQLALRPYWTPGWEKQVM